MNINNYYVKMFNFIKNRLYQFLNKELIDWKVV